MSDWHELGPDSQVIKDQIFATKADGIPLICVRDKEGKIQIYQDECSHQAIKLSEFGEIEDGELICYAHGARFCLESGSPQCMPATSALEKFPTKVESGILYVDLDG